MTAGGVRVLVVDDSAVTRLALRHALLADCRIVAVDVAADGRAAVEQCAAFDPDVLTLDVEMPGMDGLSTLRRIMGRLPRPVIMVSAHTFTGAEKTIRALEWGAVDVIQKPFGQAAFESIAADLRNKVVALGEARRKNPVGWRRWSGARLAATTAQRPAALAAGAELTTLVVMGASTGGTEALHYILASLPSDYGAPIVVAQHMPEFFTGAFARRLDELCAITVKESSPRDLLRAGCAIVARGNRHLTVRKQGRLGHVEQSDLPPVNGQRPSVNVLFRSAAALKDVLVVGVLLTGMGRDGAEGMLALRQAGAVTIAQDESSCVVYGMPRAAVELEAAEHVAEIRSIPGLLMSALSKTSPRLVGPRPSMGLGNASPFSRAGAAVTPSPTPPSSAGPGGPPSSCAPPERPPSGRYP